MVYIYKVLFQSYQSKYKFLYAVIFSITLEMQTGWAWYRTSNILASEWQDGYYILSFYVQWQ